MKPEIRFLLWAGAGALGIAMLFVFLRTREDVPGPGTPESDVIAAAETATSTPDRTSTAPVSDAAVLPWQRAPGQQPQSRQSALKAAAVHSATPMDRGQLMARMQEQLQRNQATADAALQRIDQIQASGEVPAGVDLPALRENLMLAKQAQALAIELTRANSEPDTPAREQKIAGIVVQLQALQTRLQTQMKSRAGVAPQLGQQDR